MEGVMIIMKYLKCDISLLLILFINLFTGFFKEILLIYLIILFHELGHIFFILLFKKKINYIKISIFGIYVKTDSLKNLNKIKKTLINLGRNYYKHISNFDFETNKYNIINSNTYKI